MEYRGFRCLYNILLLSFLLSFLPDLSFTLRGEVSRKVDPVKLHQLVVESLPDRIEEADSLVRLLSSLCVGRGDSLEGLSLFDRGEVAFYQGAYQKACLYYGKSIVLFTSLKGYDRLISLYLNMGLSKYYLGRYREALRAYLKVSELVKHHGEPLDKALCFHDMALVHDKLGNFESARTFFESSLRLCRRNRLREEEASIYNDYASFLNRQQDYEESINSYEKALVIFRELGNTHRANIVLFNMGCFYASHENFKKAEPYLLKSKNYFEAIDDKVSLMSVYSQLGDLYYHTGKSVLSVPLFLQVEKLSKALGRTFIRHKNLYSLFQVYKSVGRYPEAIEVLETYQQLKDSLEAQSPSSKEAMRSWKLEKELLDQELDLSRAEVRERNLISLAVCLLALLLLAVVWIYGRHKLLVQERKKNEYKHRIYRLQMNPHFIFNVLTYVQGYIMENKSEEASDFLGDVAQVIRRTLEASFVEFISLEEEIDFLRDYFKVQCKCFDKKIALDLNTNLLVPSSLIQFPPMLIQPFIENALKHAGLEDRQSPLLSISIKQEVDKVEVTVEDNGVGLLLGASSPDKTDHRSRGVEIVKERLALLTQKYKGGRPDLEMTDLSSEGRQGTRIRFWVPLIFAAQKNRKEERN